MNVAKMVKDLGVSVEVFEKKFFECLKLCKEHHLDPIEDMPLGRDSVEGAVRVVTAIACGTANNPSWIQHVGSEIERLLGLLENFEQKAPTMVTIKHVVAETDIEEARRRLQPKRYFGRNKARPVRVHFGFA